MAGKVTTCSITRKILAVYDQFLDRWGFRAAFPSASELFRSIGPQGVRVVGPVDGKRAHERCNRHGSDQRMGIDRNRESFRTGR